MDESTIYKKLYDFFKPEILKVINSPKFTSKDINYFHRSSFKFSSEIINYILSLFKESKKTIEKNKFLKSNYHNISLA